MTENKWKSHSSENCFGKRSDNQYYKDELGRSLGNRADVVKHYKKSKHKQKRDLKAPKKQNNMLFSMANIFFSRRDIKNTK